MFELLPIPVIKVSVKEIFADVDIYRQGLMDRGQMSIWIYHG